MTMGTERDRGILSEESNANRDQIKEQVMGYFEAFSEKELDNKGEWQGLVTNIMDCPDKKRIISNVAYKDGIVFGEGDFQDKPRPVATRERTFKDNEVISSRYSYVYKDSSGTFNTMELLEEAVQDAGNNPDRLLPKITISIISRGERYAVSR